MTSLAPEPKRVLVTGSTGAIGQPVCQHLLSRGHYVRGFARRPSPGMEDYVQGDLADRDKVRKAVEGMDTIVHLGAYPDEADFMQYLLGPNVIGLYNICEAAAEFGVKRLSLASSIQTIRGLRKDEGMLRAEDGYAPMNHYALTKVWAEATGDMYARLFNLSVVNVRIGWLPRNPDEANALRASDWGEDVFFSHADAQRFYERVVESPTPAPGESVTVFAISRYKHSERLDIELPRRVLGYVPQDTWPEGLNFEYSLE
jgi:uronate dehydrogenase